jgi:hypothetical protein
MTGGAATAEGSATGEDDFFLRKLNIRRGVLGFAAVSDDNR